MTPEQKQRVEELRKWRLNQPSMTSEEFAEQVKRNRANVSARCAAGSGEKLVGAAVRMLKELKP